MFRFFLCRCMFRDCRNVVNLLIGGSINIVECCERKLSDGKLWYMTLSITINLG